MSTGKKVAGIIMSVIGGILLFIVVIYAIVIFAVGGAVGKAKEDLEEKLENFYAHAVETEGVITNVNVDNGLATVEYYAEVDDSYHQFMFLVSNSDFKEGDAIVIYYDKNNPAASMAPDWQKEAFETFGPVSYDVGAGEGIFFTIIGLGLLIGGIVLIKKSKSS